MDRIEERELVGRAKLGDKEAYGKLIKHYQNRLFHRAMSLLGDRDVAQDALQSSLLSAYKALPRFRGESSIYTWLYRIVTNRSRDYLSKFYKGQIDFSIDSLEPIFTDERFNLEKNFELLEETNYLMSKINFLPEKYRVLIVYRYYDNLSYAEISELLHIRVGTVKSRLFKSRSLLREAIVRDGREEDFSNL